MEYDRFTHYPLSELDNILNWWNTNKEYVVYKHPDYIDIAFRPVDDPKTPALLFLKNTDWVIIKIYEASLLHPDEVDSLKNQYAEILQKREEARQKINELEELIEEIENGTKN